MAEKQLTAIARAILQNAKLIFMDEPTTTLSQKEVDALFNIIRNLQSKGISIVFVSHKLNEVMKIAERIVILRNGEKVLNEESGKLDQAQIAYHMVGYELVAPMPPIISRSDATPLLRVDKLILPNSFEDISFEIQTGEVLGITGLLGSGRTDLALALFGVAPAASGTIEIDGKVVQINNIQDAIQHRIGYVPEDRLTEGLFLERSIGGNIVVRKLPRMISHFGIIQRIRIAQEIKNWVSQLNIKTDDPQLPVQSLSGGNQQRVVLAKWLASSPRLLILNGPTVGVDVGSKAELHRTIRDLAQQGMSVIIISDDIPELMQTCNRILLMRSGTITDEFITAEITGDFLSQKLREAIQA